MPGRPSSSTYALDVVATATGLAAAASGVLAGLGDSWLVAVLVASYAAWGVGLRTNLAANTRLLATTGTSTNVLSKAAYELARRRSPRVRRWAASGAYVATELAKELPYYAGAFGAAVVADPVEATDAITFLAGANLGAAAYEYALGRGTSAYVRHRTASFDSDWEPAAYLRDYYRHVEPDEVDTIAFFVRELRAAERGQPVLYFGTGPTLHHVFLAAPLGAPLHLGDYLDGNLEEIRRWLDREPSAHDWRPFVHHTLRCESDTEPTDVRRRPARGADAAAHHPARAHRRSGALHRTALPHGRERLLRRLRHQHAALSGRHSWATSSTAWHRAVCC